MKSATAFLGVFGVLTCTLRDEALAQGITVQQPAVGVFSVDTVVSVPDRGRMLLGGVTSAGSGRSSYGFGPFRQSAYGQFGTSSRTDVGVYVFDFEAMDQALLAQPPARPGAAVATPHAEDAWLFAERNRPVSARIGNAPPRGVLDRAPLRSEARQGPPETDDPAQLAAFYLERGRSAESKGKSGAAILCYRMAARYGSRDAAEQLSALEAN